MSSRQLLRIDVHVELICPWCQIGKRHLDRALAHLRVERQDVAIQTHWHLQQLLPDLPETGRPFADFYVERLGSMQAVAARQAQVCAAGRSAGLEFDFARIERMPHTGLAHALLHDAREQLDAEAFEALLDRLFEAHFQCGQDLGDPVLLLTLAEAFGVQPSAELPPAVISELRVPGVPYFVFNQRYALSGAQASGQLLAIMRQALDR